MNNQKKSLVRRLLPWIITLIIAVCLVVFVGIPIWGTPETVNEYPPEIIFGDDNPTKAMVMENDDLRFELDPTTSYFTLTDKASGQVWTSVPADGTKDKRATATTTKESLGATLMVGYKTDQGAVEMNNYGNSITNNNFRITTREDGSVAVQYAIGKINRVYILPQAIPKDRMKSFTSQLKKADVSKVESLYTLVNPADLDNPKKKLDKEALIAQYPSIVDQPLYILKSGNKPQNLANAEALLAKAGYTQEDYAADMTLVANVEDSTTGPVFNVTLVYRLEGRDLLVEVPYEEIRYRSEYPITSLTVLPMFGTVKDDQEGSMLVPEGGGALIQCNNGRLTQNSYYVNIYGWDYGTERDEAINETRAVFPVFGVLQDSGSFICMIEDGASYGSIQADISGRVSSYNTVNARYTVLHSDQFNVSAKSSRLVYMYEEQVPTDTVVQRYRFLTGGSYVDAATAYGDRLRDMYDGLSDGTASQETPISVELLGAIDKKVVKLGLPVDSVVSTTTFSEAQDIIKALSDSGVKELNVRFNGWMNGGVKQKVATSVHVLGELGGTSGMKKLNEYAKSQGVDLYYDGISCFALDSGLTNGFIAFRDASRLTTREQIKLYPYMVNLYIQDKEQDPYYLLKAPYADNCATRLRTDLAKLGAQGVGYRDIGYLLSSDFTNKHTVTREQVKKLNTAQLEAAKTSGLKVAVRAGNDYVLDSADIITDMDLDGQRYGILDQSIPFYQIAIHGAQDYTGNAINLAGNWKRELLNCAEYGSGLHFSFMAEDASILQDTFYSSYRGANFSGWQSTLIPIMVQYQQDMAGLNTLRITGHRLIAQGVTATEYENGTVVYVNYQTTDYSADGINIPAESYVVERSAQ